MAAPYVSIKRLTDNSLAAMLAAVEVYNKPQMTYRDEVVVTLVVNAWELALKAALQQQRISIFYRKTRGQPYRSISISDALERVNKKLSGRELNTHDHLVVCWKESLRDNTKYAWRHNEAATHVWSGDAVSYLTSIPDERYDEMRGEYRLHQQAQRLAKVK